MGRSLVIRPFHRLVAKVELKDYWKDCMQLVIRHHELGGTDYNFVCWLTDEMAEELVELSNGSIQWLFGPPDFARRAKEKKLRELKQQVHDLEKELCNEDKSVRGASVKAG